MYCCAAPKSTEVGFDGGGGYRLDPPLFWMLEYTGFVHLGHVIDYGDVPMVTMTNWYLHKMNYFCP